jgi:hypothetical protein
MDNFREETALNLSKMLRRLLKIKYPHTKLTAAFVASQYNLRARSSGSISNETARKWLSGISIPAAHRLQVLTDWLGIQNADFVYKQDVPLGHNGIPPADTSNLSYDQLVMLLMDGIDGDKEKIQTIIKGMGN